jgi:hypothetical protein
MEAKTSWSGSSDSSSRSEEMYLYLYISLDFGILLWLFIYRRLVQGVKCVDEATALHTAPCHVRRVS